MTLIQLVLPVFFLAVGMPSQGVLLDDVSAPPLTLDLKAFGQSYIPYTLGLDPSAAQTGFAALYKAQFGNTQIMEKFSMPPVSDPALKPIFLIRQAAQFFIPKS